ncbi:PQQ-dependent sugar dehydrogenase [uncultured Shimia sp.]|uniref:PQQ-dependent sugar dehydrogenase n=1 Tax=uncultured Shimia sp. TaxID=573152 RepID=UPI0025D019B7|nr:PQQ-dependent sugar dehydrogenase [uncultured Shimia sp.]
MRSIIQAIALLLLVSLPCSSVASELETSQGKVHISAVVESLKGPWAFAFLPDGELLITEKRGKLLHVTASGKRSTVKGLPAIHVQGQGGLLDIIVANDFVQSRTVFLSYVTKQKGGSGTAVMRARLSEDRKTLTNQRKIFEMSEGSSGGRHFGSRIVHAKDGSLYVTIGERGDRSAAQNLARHEGTIVRLSSGGAVLSNNPFLATNSAQKEIWSYGHRNPQGLALDLSGRLWAVEHGAKGGDELNLIRKGANYGWPVISYGTHYSGFKIGEGTSKAGMQQPKFYWDPSIAPSGLMVYSGKLWPQWKGHFFVGSLKSDYVSRLSGSPLKEREKLQGKSTKRVRDVREGPHGGIWFLSEDKGTLYRMAPSG